MRFLLRPDWAAQDGGQIIRLDPALDALVSPNAKIEKLADGMGFLEGPVWVHSSGAGYLLFSDIPANVIDKWNPQDGKVSVFLAKSGFAGADFEIHDRWGTRRAGMT